MWEDVEFKAVIFCDDIRQEDNGKSLIIGVYDRGMTLQKLPHNVQLSLFVQFVPKRLEFDIFGLRLRNLDGAEFIKVEGPMKLENAGVVTTISLNNIVIPTSSPTTAILQCKVNDSDWQEVHRIDISLLPDIANT